MHAWTDGHHKFICWRLITHAGIDGFSRLIVFYALFRQQSVINSIQQFLEATRKYGLPSRVKTDQHRGTAMVALSQGALYMIKG